MIPAHSLLLTLLLLPGLSNPKTARFEMDLLAAVNELRKASKLEALPMDERLGGGIGGIDLFGMESRDR